MLRAIITGNPWSLIYKIYTKCISKWGETTRRETSRCEHVIGAKPPVTFYITHLLSDLLYAIHRHRHMKLRKKKNISTHLFFCLSGAFSAILGASPGQGEWVLRGSGAMEDYRLLLRNYSFGSNCQRYSLFRRGQWVKYFHLLKLTFSNSSLELCD